jgi:hypothetical protein
MNRLRLPRRFKALLWRLRDQVRAPKLEEVSFDTDPLYEMLAAQPAWERRKLLAHGAGTESFAPDLPRRRRAG